MAFFRPASRTVDFSLRFTNSGHVIILLWLCGLQNTDHVMPFWLFPRAAAKENRELNTKAGQSFVSGKALFEDIRRGIIDTVVQNGGARYLFSFFWRELLDVTKPGNGQWAMGNG